MRRSERENWILINNREGLKQWDLSAKRYDDAVEEALNSLGYEVVDEKDAPD